MDIKIELNLPQDDYDKTALERINQAEQAKAQVTETLHEAWLRILAMKNSKPDQERLLEVRQAMQDGEIERSADAKGRFSKAEALRLWKDLNEAKREQRLKEMVDNTPANYKLVTTEQQLETLVWDLRNEPIIAVDTETTGVDVYFDKIVGVSFTLPQKDYHVYVPCGHLVGQQLSRSIVLGRLKGVLESPRVKKVMHNSKFDMHMFATAGINVKGLVWDTMHAMHLLNENEESYALKNLVTKYLREPSDTYATLFGKTPFAEIPLDVALVYAGKDTHVTWKLYLFQLMHLEKQPKLLNAYRDIELPTVEVAIEMERTGFVLDEKRANTLQNQLSTELEELEVQLKIHFGDINFNSPKQLSEMLFEELGLAKHLPPKYKISTDVKTIKILAKHHEGCELLLKYREKTKLLGTYIEALPKQIKPFDNRIHGNFNQTGTVTGRFSSNNPNLQNQPKYARTLFIAPKGMIILGFDFSQQEPRLLTHFTQEEGLLKAYNNGEDLYTKMASEVFGKPQSECGDGSVYRKMMKFGVLSVMYGTGPKTLAGQLKITEAEAEIFISDFYKTYPKVAQWIEGNKAQARKQGYVETMFGRKRRLKGAKSNDKWERLRNERQATNAIIQGSASEQTKITMLKLHAYCVAKREAGRDFRMLATVHDEVLLYVPQDITKEEYLALEDIMLNTVKLSVPNKTDAEFSLRWGEGMTVEQFFTGKVKRSDFKEDKEADYLKHRKLVEQSWQGALVA
jgi:DNA polymerase-1